MKKYIIALALSASLLGLGLPAYAAAKKPDAPVPARSGRPAAVLPTIQGEATILTMKSALSIALEKNFTVLTAQESVSAAKGQSKAASAALNPQLSLVGEANAYDRVPNSPENELISRAALTQSLYSGGRNQALSKQGKLAVKQSEATLRDTQEQVAQTVWNAFCEVLYRREELRNTQEAYDYYTSAEKDLQQRVLYGLSTNLDLTRVRQQRENARANNITASNNLDVARIELCRLLRLRPETPLELSGTLEDGLPTIEDSRAIPNDPDTVIKNILDRRGDLQALKRAADSQRQQITVAKSGMLPTLELSGGYRMGYHEEGYASSPSKNQWTASLSLNVPVYDGGSTSGNVRAARANLKAAEHAVAEKEDQIKSDLADAWLSLQNALETVQAGRVNLQLAKESLAYAESGYREGVNTQLDVLEARSELTDAYQTLALYLRNAREAQADLWKAEGNLVERALSDIAPSVSNTAVKVTNKKK